MSKLRAGSCLGLLCVIAASGEGLALTRDGALAKASEYLLATYDVTSANVYPAVSCYDPSNPEYMAKLVPGSYVGLPYWFAIRGQPGRQYRKAELDSLGARGVLKEDTRLLAVGYRFMVKAGTATEARTVAKAELPTRPPRQVRKELLRLEREHQARLKEPSPPVPRP